MKFSAAILSCILWVLTAHVANSKNSYLIIGGGENASVYGYKSEAKCEAAKKSYFVWLKKARLQYKSIPQLAKVYEKDGNPRCRPVPPVGFVRQ